LYSSLPVMPMPQAGGSLSRDDRVIAVLGFVSGIVGLTAFVWRVPRATPTARWLFRPREGLDSTGGNRSWLIGGASGVILSALLPFGAEIALTGFLAGLGFALVVLGGAALSLGHVR
jgi:hypothetical protein